MVKNAFKTTWSRDDQLKIHQGQEKMPARRTGRTDEVTSKYRATAPVLRLVPSMVLEIF